MMVITNADLNKKVKDLDPYKRAKLIQIINQETIPGFGEKIVAQMGDMTLQRVMAVDGLSWTTIANINKIG